MSDILTIIDELETLLKDSQKIDEFGNKITILVTEVDGLRKSEHSLRTDNDFLKVENKYLKTKLEESEKVINRQIEKDMLNMGFKLSEDNK